MLDLNVLERCGKKRWDLTSDANDNVSPDGTVVQTAGYYPDGESWEEPAADNPYLFGGRERVTLGGLCMDDFGFVQQRA